MTAGEAQAIWDASFAEAIERQGGAQGLEVRLEQLDDEIDETRKDLQAMLDESRDLGRLLMRAQRGAGPGWEIVACAHVHTQERAIEAATHFTAEGWRVRVDGEWGKSPRRGGPVVVAERRRAS